jgi:hypothetical protein
MRKDIIIPECRLEEQHHIPIEFAWLQPQMKSDLKPAAGC